MSPFQSCMAMVRYHLNRPWRTWIFLPILGMNSILLNPVGPLFRGMNASGIGQLLGPFSIMFNLILALFFIAASASTASTSFAWILPHAEFLFIRPIPRARLYFTLIGIFFVVLLTCPLINVILTATHQPDLFVALRQGTPALHALPVYQQVFPSSVIVPVPGRDYSDLIIPYGATLITLWFLWEVFVLGLILQALALIRFPKQPSRLMRFVLTFPIIGLCLAVIGVIEKRIHINLEPEFFFWIQHPWVTAMLTAGLFALVQWGTLKRIAVAEVP